MRKFYSVLFPLMNEGDPLGPAGGGGAKGLTCEVCESRLAANGDSLKVSAKAKKMLAADEALADAQSRIDALTREVAALKDALAAEQAKHAPVAPAASGSRWSLDV